MDRYKINKAFVDGVDHPGSGQKIYRDSELTGFALRVTVSVKSFIVERKINNKSRRVKIGTYPEITVAQARSEALRLISEMVLGKLDPKLTLVDKEVQAISLDDVFSDYCRAKKLRPNTVRGYETSLKIAFSDWRTLPMVDISRDMVLKRHQELSRHSERQANNHSRFLNALFNFAMVRYEFNDKRRVFTENPGRIINESSAWNRETRRKSVIKAKDLPAWYKAVKSIGGLIPNRNELYARVAFPLFLYTGFRRSELLSLTVERIDLDDRVIKVPAELAKNHQELISPMSDQVYTLVSDWLDLSGIESGPIFPAKAGKLGYCQNLDYPKKEVIKKSGVGFMLHDLRRTFAGIGESIGVPHVTLKKLLNHVTDSEVTEGYIIRDTDDLRKSMQNISNKIYELINSKS